jgi:hypothetical protein
MPSGSKSVGTKANPYGRFIRLPDGENTRLDRVLKYRSLSFQTFGRNALMKAILEVEEEMKRDDEARSSKKGRKAEPRGLGIREQLEERASKMRQDDDEFEPTPRAPAAAAPSVTVNLPIATSEIDTLARLVAAATPEDRVKLLRAACAQLAKTARTAEEAESLASQLDEAIKRFGGSGARPKGRLDTIVENVHRRMRR